MNEVEWLKKEWVKTAILYAIIIGGVIVFQLGLRVALRTQYPLAAVESPSMVPTLLEGDIILVRGLNAGEIKVGKIGENPEGDIIVFYDPTGRTRTVYWFFKERALIVHRAVDKAYVDGVLRFQTQGDNPYTNPSPDQGSDPRGWVAETKVVGKVVGRVPWFGYVSLYMQSDAGMMLIVVLFIVMIVIDYIALPIWESLKSEKKEI